MVTMWLQIFLPKNLRKHIKYTMQTLYNTPHYNTDSDTIWSQCGSQILFIMEFYKEIIGKWPYNGHLPIIPLKNCLFIARFAYNIVQSYRPHR